MKYDHEEIIRYSEKALSLFANQALNHQEREWVISETIEALKDNLEPDFSEEQENPASFSNRIIEWESSGSSFIDIQGRKYLDCLGVSSLNSIGYLRSKILESIKKPLELQALNNPVFYNPQKALLARLLAMITPGKLQCSVFCSSADEAVEGAISLALYNNNSAIIVKTGNYCSDSLSNERILVNKKESPEKQRLKDHVLVIPYEDIAMMDKAFSNNSYGEAPGAIIIEPINHEEGIVVPSQEYINKICDLCEQYETLLIVNETKIGLGRTGKLFAIEHYGLEPDILCLGNALGGGIMPIGAFITTSDVLKKNSYSPSICSKLNNNRPVSYSAAIAAVQVILDEGLVEKAAEKGAYILPNLQRMVRKYPILKEARGKGLLIGLEFTNEETASDMAKSLLREGIITTASAKKRTTLRIEPALTIKLEEIDFLLKTLEMLLNRKNHKQSIMKGVDFA